MSQEQAVQRKVQVPDGRWLAVEVTGALDGSPVFLMHGTPGSRSGPKPRGIVLYRLGVRLISYDRPGYGGSDRHENRSVADAAADVAAIADDLGIDRFAVVGRSGGGPHALACAALLPRRVTRAAVLVGLAPANAPDLDWYSGMGESNVDDYSTVDNDASAIALSLTTRAAHTRQDPESMVRFLRPSLSASDRRVVDDVAMRRLLAATWAEAVQHGAEGWIDDVLALRRNWGFDVRSVNCRVRLWHGEDDTFSPVGHTRWLAAQIRNAELEVQPGAAHFNAVEMLPQTLTWLTAASVGSPVAVPYG